MKKALLRLAFLGYCALMLWLLFGQRLGVYWGGDYWAQVKSNLNLEPMYTLKRFVWVLRNSQNGADVRHAAVNLAGNVLMFIPLGFLLPAVFPRLGRFWRFLGAVAAILVLVEVTQLFALLGSCDVDDLILNTLGVFMGYILWRLIRKT